MNVLARDTKKVGSFQAYCPHDCSSEDLGPSMFDVDQVHAIACLDIRLINQDRHTGNLLVQRNMNNRLIPIDHGCCLPDLDFMDETTFAWLYWPQAKVPLSAVIKAYVATLDSFEQAARMQPLNPPPKAIIALHVGTSLLKKCVLMGLTLFDIGQLLVRCNPAVPCPVETLLIKLNHLNPDTQLLPFLHAFEIALVKEVRRRHPQSTCNDRERTWVAKCTPRKSPTKVLLSTAA